MQQPLVKSIFWVLTMRRQLEFYISTKQSRSRCGSCKVVCQVVNFFPGGVLCPSIDHPSLHTRSYALGFLFLGEL